MRRLLEEALDAKRLLLISCVRVEFIVARVASLEAAP